MGRHCEIALATAQTLESRDDVQSIAYPRLPFHLQYDVAARQMRAGGGMISLIPTGGVERATRLVESTTLLTLVESLGGIESLIELPGAMTHQSVAGSPLEVPAALVRISVGIELVDDLIATCPMHSKFPRMPWDWAHRQGNSCRETVTGERDRDIR